MYLKKSSEIYFRSCLNTHISEACSLFVAYRVLFSAFKKTIFSSNSCCNLDINSILFGWGLGPHFWFEWFLTAAAGWGSKVRLVFARGYEPRSFDSEFLNKYFNHKKIYLPCSACLKRTLSLALMCFSFVRWCSSFLMSSTS